MKIVRLDLERFGHFRGKQLTFGEGTQSRMCIVQGDNEAGKTTVLEAIRALVFGVPTKSRYGVRVGDDDDAKVTVAARIELDRGFALELQRSSGRGETLHGHVLGTGDEIDTEWLSTRLGHPTRAVFESVFAFSLDALAKGAEALAHDEVKNAIYGSGLGGALRPSEILADLRGKARALFASGASKPKINATAAKVEALRKEIRRTTTRSEQYDALAADLARKRQIADARAEETRGLRRGIERARALLDGVEPHRALRAAEHELAGLHVSRDLAEGSGVAYRAALETRDRLRDELDELHTLRAQAREALDRLSVDEELLQHGAAIDDAFRAFDRHRAALAEHPRAIDERDDMLRAVAERLASVCPGWSVDRLRASRFETAHVAELFTALDEHDARTSERSDVARALREHESALTELETKLSVLPPSLGDATSRALRGWLEEWSGREADRASLEKLRARLAGLDRTLARPLDPPFTDATVPRDEAVARFERDFLASDRSLERAVEQVEEAHVALERTARERAMADAAAVAPNEEQLQALRAKRDERWSTIVAGKSKPSRSAVAGFERAVVAADDAADKMRLFAESVQRRAQLSAAVDAQKKAHHAATARLDEQRARRKALEAEWRATWKGAAIEPHPPSVMRAWLREREARVEANEQRTLIVEEEQALTQRLASFLDRARRLLGDDGLDLDAARIEAREVVATEERRARDALALESQRIHHQTKLHALRARRAEIEDEAGALAQKFPSLLAALGLPFDHSIDAARAVVQGLLSLREQLVEREPPLERRIERLAREIEEYAERLRVLAHLDADPSALHRRLVDAREAAARREEKSRACDELDARTATATRALDKVERHLEQMRARARAHDDPSFAAAAAARDRAASLERTIADRRAELQRLARGLPLDEYLLLLDGGEVASPLDLERDERAIERIEGEVRALDVELGALETRKAQIESSEGAATLLADLELERSSIRDDVERFAVLTLAEQILRDAIARFEREHQPALLARASTIFEEMTMGRHRVVRRNIDGTVSVERNDGRTLAPEALSTGTREQLFLAIRLAYVDHYRRNAESLPVVLDDVLVNFDDHRAEATLRALATFARDTQVLLFTCHPHLLALAERAKVDAGRTVIA